jgi:hypothetical protein
MDQELLTKGQSAQQDMLTRDALVQIVKAGAEQVLVQQFYFEKGVVHFRYNYMDAHF